MELKIENEAIAHINTNEGITTVSENVGDKTAGGMTEEAYNAKMSTAASLVKTIPEEKIPPEKKGFFDKIKNSFSNMKAKWEASKMATADKKIGSHTGLSGELARAQGNPEQVLALRKYVAAFPDENSYYIKYNEKTKEYEENSKRKSVVLGA
jgi:hypothetical protein